MTNPYAATEWTDRDADFLSGLLGEEDARYAGTVHEPLPPLSKRPAAQPVSADDEPSSGRMSPRELLSSLRSCYANPFTATGSSRSKAIVSWGLTLLPVLLVWFHLPLLVATAGAFALPAVAPKLRPPYTGRAGTLVLIAFGVLVLLSFDGRSGFML